ncbi:MAG: hypothetical protein U1D06_12970, partial [Paracoccaceae bacterium]|nr:hypothetical protein [Paracoccaceae bacterium]
RGGWLMPCRGRGGAVRSRQFCICHQVGILSMPRTILPKLIAMLALLAIAGCAGFPEIRRAEAQAGQGAAPPLLPMDQLVARVGGAQATDASREALAARAARLRARAAEMRNRQVG